jgi:hypothetical protein
MIMITIIEQSDKYLSNTSNMICEFPHVTFKLVLFTPGDAVLFGHLIR